jgi:hypothetical protein
MQIGELFETRVEEKIEPVIKVSETADEHKLAAEIGSYVVTPLIERHLDDFLEHYTDTFLSQTTEIGVWISGYFGSGKSHLAKIMALLVEDRTLEGASACDRFAVRIPPDAPRRNAILRSLKRVDQCETQVLAFNLNVLVGDKDRPLPGLLLSQYYLSRGYSNNLIYARVIEAELDKQGKLDALHSAVEARAKKSWIDVQRNLSFYRTHLYAAACEVAPDVFPSPQDVTRALQDAERGEIYNVDFLVSTILADLKQREQTAKKPRRMLLVLDESGQWIATNRGRLDQLQALIEEAAVQGQGKVWIVVTTHGDMGSIYQEARARESDMKKIEGRFRFKPALTTENIELVLENRLFRKKLAGLQELDALYASRGGVLRGIGELANTSQTLPSCTADKFAVYYPFFPYQVHLIPEVVKSLRSKGGRGEQMSGSTRTLLAITQDVLRSGRRPYLDEPLGALVSFDEVYHNLAGEGEISPDVRTEISRIKDAVPGATGLTPRVAEVLYLVHELAYIPRTRDNVARFLVETVDDDLPTVLSRVEPELERLIRAKLVARIGEEYEFLTGERRTFEEEVATVEAQYRHQDRERGLVRHFIHDSGKGHWRRWLGSATVRFHEQDFSFKLMIDGGFVPGTQGHVTLRVSSPLTAFVGVTLADLENQSLQADEQQTIFFLSGRVPGVDQDLTRFLAMKEVIDNWKGDPHKSEEARKLAHDRETDDLPKLEARVLEGLKEGLRTGHLVFRGASRSLVVPPGQTPENALRSEMAAFWPVLYPKFGRVPTRIPNEQRAIQDVLAGASDLSTDVKTLKLYDKAGQIDLNSPLLGDTRIYLATEQNAGRRVLGKSLLDGFAAPPYGWDPNAVRVGLAALVRAGAVKVLINKKPYTNPADRELVDALRVSRNFDRVELVLEETEPDPKTLTETRTFLIHLARRRNIDETPAALSEAADALAETILAKADTVNLWAGGSGMPLADEFTEGEEAWRKVVALSNPVHRVREVHAAQSTLEVGSRAIEAHAQFQAQHGAQFTELVQLKDRLEAIEHRLVGSDSIQSFLEEYRVAAQAAGFADAEVWKRLQSLKARAMLELIPLLGGWRDEARRQLQDTLDRLPEELAQRQLDPAIAQDLAAPLVALQKSLETVTLPAQVAALPGRAAQAIRQLGVCIVQETARKEPEKFKPEARQVRSLRASDVATVTRVRNVAEWEELMTKLDQRVRSLLDEGYDVELN